MAQQPVPDYQSLAGTMDPAGVFSLLQAAQAQQAAELAQKTQGATQAAGQAQQQYQGAAQAPPPDLGMQQLIPSLFGNVASVIAENPMYAQQAQQSNAQQKADAMKARAENIQALQDVYRQRAEEAKQAGDTETELNSRTKFENLHKLGEVVIANRDRADKKAQQERDRIADLNRTLESQGVESQYPNVPAEPYRMLPTIVKDKLSEAIGGNNPDMFFGGQLKTLDGPDGQPIQILPSELFKGNAGNAAIAWASQNGIVMATSKEVSQAQDIQTARDNITDMLSQLESTGNQPLTPLQRAGSYIGLKTGAMAQIFPTEAAFNSWRTAAIRNLRATAGSGGLRINQREIELAVANDLPQYTDTQAVARQKMENIRIMLNNGLRPLVTNDWRKSARENFTRGATLLPTKGPVWMMDPTGKMTAVPRGDFSRKIGQGWARIVTQTSVVPPSAMPNSGPTIGTAAEDSTFKRAMRMP